MAAVYLLGGAFCGIAGTAIAMGGPSGFGALFVAAFVLVAGAASAEYHR